MLSHTDCYVGAVDSRAVWGRDMDMPPIDYSGPQGPNRKERRKHRVVKRRRGFPRGASAHRMTTGAGT